MAVEEIHYNLYNEAFEAVQMNKDLPDRKVFVCEICGNTVYDEAPEKCPVCGAPRAKFKEIS
jgi:rubrerythrin